MSLLKHWLRRRRSARKASPRGRLSVEMLESRRLLATFQPDTFNDDNDGNFSAGDFSLREAVILANTNNETDTIILQAGTYQLTIRGANEDASQTGDLDLYNGLTIRGQGAGQTIITADGSRSLNDRVFQVFDLASVIIEDLTITGGSAPTGSDGGAVLTAASLILRDLEITGNEAARDGGGVANQGVAASLVIQNTQITNNTAGDYGGGIHNMSSLSVSDVTISGNVADDGAGVANRSNAQANGSLAITETTISGNVASNYGGGIYNSNPGVQLGMVNSTVSGNDANRGAGIVNTNGATLGIASSTITANDASNSGGGIRADGGNVGVKNTIIAGNFGTNPDLQASGGTFASDGNNLIGNRGTVTAFVDGFNGDIVGSSSTPVDPHLGPLADNGGPTETHAISYLSPALDAGNNSGAPTIDQRGFPRPVGPNVDIGAYELSMDLGDAPQGPYPTRIDRNGAAHAFGAPTSPRLGTRLDTEVDGQPNSTATGDDLSDQDDEDGISFPSTIRVGQLDATVNVLASRAGLLDAWIDFHGDGSWDAQADRIFTREPVVAGLNQLEFSVPHDALVGNTFARFRITSVGAPGPRGFAFDGEVEDYRVTIAALTGTGTFTGGASLGTSTSRDLALGDVDNDGDLDAFVANDSSQPNRVWINQGGLQGGVAGNFLNSGQSIGFSSSQAVALGDVDGDGDLDAFIANGSEPDRVYLNQGGLQGGTLGVFVSSGQSLGLGTSTDVVLGDLDGDGDLDAVGATLSVNRVLFNQGGLQGGTEGLFADPQSFGNDPSYGVALGDFDLDGDLDVFMANNGPNRVWINQGYAQNGVLGELVNSGQSLGTSNSRAVSVGDLDGDGDLDAFVANAGGQGNRVWINQGGVQGGTAGVFVSTGQAIGSSDSRDVALGDVDGDGDLDAYVANTNGQPNRVYINQGGAQAGTPAMFLSNGQALGTANSDGVQLGDLDLDGDLDAMVANASPNRIWLNEVVLPTPVYDFTVANYSAAEGDTTSNVVMLTRTNATSAASSVDVVLTGVTATVGTDFVAGPVTVQFAAGETSRPVPITLLGDALDEANETIALTLANFTPDGEAGTSQPSATFTILDDDPTPTVTLDTSSESIDEAGGQATLTATLSAVSGRTVTVSLGFSGTAMPGDYTASSSLITIPAGNLTGTATVTAVDDLIHDPGETVVVDIIGVSNAIEVGTQQARITIDDDDIPGAGTTTVAILDGALLIEDAVDEATDDRITLALAGASLQIIDPNNTFTTNIPGATGNGTTQVSVPLSAFSTISVTTKGGVDSLTFDATLTAALAAVVSFDGGSQDDTLIVAGGGVTVAVSQLTDVDVVDMRGSGDDQVNFTLASVLNNVDSPADALTAFADAGDSVQFDSGWTIQTTFVAGGHFFRALRQGGANVHLAGPADWQNPLNSLDVSADGSVVALDALQIINEINGPNYSDGDTGALVDAKSLPDFPRRFYDVTGDGFVTPGDVLRVINFLNMAAAGGEGEAAASPEPVTPSYAPRLLTSTALPRESRAGTADPPERDSHDRFFASLTTANQTTKPTTDRLAPHTAMAADEIAELLSAAVGWRGELDGFEDWPTL